jgi:type I restriction enzyme S subunit
VKVIALRVSTLGDICDETGGLIQTGPFGSQLHQSDYSEDGIPVVMPKDIVEGRVSVETVARVHPSHAERLSRHKLKVGDIIYGRRGDIGRQALIRADQAGWMCGTGCLRISLGAQLLDPLFLHYYLRQDEVVRWITNQAVGATMPNLNTQILRSVPVRFPLLPIQRRIAAILSAYDDLIENSQRRIKILEEMARRHYREWFVHFRFPGHEDCIFVDSPLGEIPEGWEVKRLDEVCRSIQDGDWIETKDQGGEDYRLLQISNIGVGEFIETGKFRYVTQETFSRLRCNEIVPGDLLVARMPTPIGRGWLATKMPWRMITAVDVAIIRAEPLMLHPLFLVRAWNEDSNLMRIAAQASGTTRLRITRRELAAMEFVVPPLSVQHQFSETARSTSAMIEALQGQIQNLHRTRDLLLPRLLSGQIDVQALPEPAAD